MAHAGGLVPYNNPERWRRDEIDAVDVDTELKAAERPASAPATAVTAPPAPKRRLLVDHRDECDKMQYEGGACTCDLIEQYGPPSERDDY